MIGMVAHPKLLPERLGDAAGGPYRAAEAEGRSASGQQGRDLGPLLSRELACWAGSTTVAEGLLSARACSLEPLAYGPVSDAQGRSNVFLLPALLAEFERSQATAFTPIMRERGG